KVPSGSLGVSPVDGKDAWACVDSGNGSFQVWATTDEGTTWHAAGLLHPRTPEQPGSCGVLADQHDTKAAVFEVTWGSGEAGTLASMSYYTRDGGAHWQQLPDWTGVSAVDTDGGTTYALITITTPPAGQPQSALLGSVSPPRFCAPCSGPGNQERRAFVVSSDGLQTWRELHPGGVTSGDGVSQFWQGPSSGDMFAATYGGALWHSSDGGASWTKSSMPVGQISLGMWLASRKAWMFCGVQGQPPVTVCSTDTGSTWRHVPVLTATVHMQCDDWCHKKGGQDSQTLPCASTAIGSDGSLLGTCPFGAQFMEYRLAPGAAQWTALGEVPSAFPTVAANDIMWCMTARDGEWETTTLPM
ncbi:MAG: hypothetical protein ACXWQ5_23830, partial [Ktedonobacterales bacterium]